MRIKSMGLKGHENLKKLIPVSGKIVLENLEISSDSDGVVFDYKYGRPLHARDDKGRIVESDWTSFVSVKIKSHEYRELIKPFVKEWCK